MQLQFRLRRIAIALAPIVAALTSVAPAAAQNGQVQIELAASIPARCGFVAGSVTGQSRTPDLEAAARFDIRINLDCNTPYAFGVVAQNGRFTNLDAAADGSGFAFEKPYLLSLALETDRGLVRSARCLSTTIVAGGACGFAAAAAGSGLSSQRGISINRHATLTVEWPDQDLAGQRLAPGRYRETLILVVGPRA